MVDINGRHSMRVIMRRPLRPKSVAIRCVHAAVDERVVGRWIAGNGGNRVHSQRVLSDSRVQFSRTERLHRVRRVDV